MKKTFSRVILFGALACTSVSAFAAQICETGTLPVFVCEAVPSDDGLYRLVNFDFTVCQGSKKVELVAADENYRTALPARIDKQTAKKIVYTVLDEGTKEVVAALEVNLQQLDKSKFTYEGDYKFQKRICRKVK